MVTSTQRHVDGLDFQALACFKWTSNGIKILLQIFRVFYFFATQLKTVDLYDVNLSWIIHHLLEMVQLKSYTFNFKLITHRIWCEANVNSKSKSQEFA